MHTQRRCGVAALVVAILAAPLPATDVARWLAQAVTQGGEVGARYTAMTATWPLAPRR
jgi:hypothetical protein